MNEEHLNRLRSGVEEWNGWREDHPDEQERPNRPDLEGANLEGADLEGADLEDAILEGANLTGANLKGATLEGANLDRAHLIEADLRGANMLGVLMNEAYLKEANLCDAVLSISYKPAYMQDANFEGAQLDRADFYGADLCGVNMDGVSAEEACLHYATAINGSFIEARLDKALLAGANFNGANLQGASLTEADLENALLLGTDLQGANLKDCQIHGASVWGVILDEDTIQSGLIINSYGTAVRWDRRMFDIPVEDRKRDSAWQQDHGGRHELGQFIYLILENAKVRTVLDSTTSKIVLILGRFADGRLETLQRLCAELQKRDYVPILFDFEPSKARDLTETVKLLANLSKGVIADLSDAKSIPQELSNIVPNLPSVPVVPILQGLDETTQPYAMFEHWERYPWVQSLFRYKDEEHLEESLLEYVLKPLDNYVKRKEVAESLRQLSRSVYRTADDQMVQTVVAEVAALCEKLLPPDVLE